jgi:TatD DNase family protein
VVDTHAHLGVCEPADGELVAAARDAGVRRILTVGMDEESNREALSAATGHDEVFACVGRHPNEAAGYDEKAAAAIEELTGDPRVRAIGETGLDYYRARAPRDAQRVAFGSQIGIARRAELPLVIHVRDEDDSTEAIDEAWRTLADEAGGLTVILHCFSAPAERVAEAAERGWYCSFAGNVTYPRSEGLRDAARRVPAELLLVETDSPFLSPQPHRGRPNEPAHVVDTAGRLAELRDLSYAELEDEVEENAARALRW